MSLIQLRNLLPLPDEELQQVLDYAETLSKQGAAEHFDGILGDSPQAVEFISSFNSRRKEPSSSSNAAPREDLSAGVPKISRGPKKKKAPLHTPAPRQIQDTYAAQGTAYQKRSEDDYMTKRPAQASQANNTFTLNPKPEAVQAPTTKLPPSAAGLLISDLKSKSGSNSRNASRTSSPAPPKTKVNITGGTSMHGASTVLTELDAAIRTLEISTNATLLDNEKRKCNCVGTRHPLLAAAPNCLHCGKVICVKEGLGPCTFCGEALLSAVEIQGMIRELREERGREKMALDASSHRRAEVAKKPAPFTAPRENTDLSPAELKAKEHRDRLLGFQAQNARRTTVRDEAADFETPMMGGGNIWASPAERAKVLKRQQKVLAEQEWNARPEYEKRRQVVSIDLVKGKVVKKMGAVERPQQPQSESEEDVEETMLAQGSGGEKSGGTFSRNPLLGGLIKPIYDVGGGDGTGKGKQKDLSAPRKKTWRRVQDDFADNEAVILDGGVFGGKTADVSAGDEPACG